jgi:hypothetical protein
MSRAFSQAKLKGAERRAILQAIQTQMQQVIIEGVTQVLEEFLEQEVTTKLGRPKLASTSDDEPGASDRLAVRPLRLHRCQPVHPRRPLPPQFGNRMGTPGRVAGAHGGMSAMRARRGGAVCHLGEVPALLARCATARDLWQWLGAEFTPTRV